MSRYTITLCCSKQSYRSCLFSKLHFYSFHLTFNHYLLSIYNKLIKNKANINAINLHGNQAIHYACHFNYTDLSIELIKLGACINQANRYNQTPIDLCRVQLRDLILSLAKSNHIDLTRISFKLDADVVGSTTRWSQSKTNELTLYSQNGINIDELPVEKMIDSNHGGTVSTY